MWRGGRCGVYVGTALGEDRLGGEIVCSRGGGGGARSIEGPAGWG